MVLVDRIPRPVDQTTERVSEFVSAFQKISEGRFIDFHSSLIFHQVSLVVGFGKRSRDRGIRPQRVRQSLKDNTTVIRPISLAPERSDCEGVSRAVGQVETAIVA